MLPYLSVFGHGADDLEAGRGDPYYEREDVVAQPPLFATYGDEKLLHLITPADGGGAAGGSRGGRRGGQH